MTTPQRAVHPSRPPSPTSGRAFAAAAGVAALAQAVYQVATPGAPGATFGSLGDWARDLLFLAYLVASVGAVEQLRRARVTGRAPAALVAVGYGMIAVGVIASLVLQEDPDWFFLLGAPGNLLAAVGFVAIAVLAWRRATLPPWAALLCGVGGLVAVAMAEFGTSVLIGSFWLAVAAGRVAVGRDRIGSSRPDQLGG